MDIKKAEAIVEKELFNNLNSINKYDEISIYKGINGCIKYIQAITGCDRHIAETIIQKHDELKPSNENIKQYEARVSKVNAEAKELLNKPKCPTCQSTNIKKIQQHQKY